MTGRLQHPRKREPNPERDAAKARAREVRAQLTNPQRWDITVVRSARLGWHWVIQSETARCKIVLEEHQPGMFCATDLHNDSSILYGGTPQEAVDAALQSLHYEAKQRLDGAAHAMAWLGGGS